MKILFSVLLLLVGNVSAVPAQPRFEIASTTPDDSRAAPEQPRVTHPDLWIDVRLPEDTRPAWIGDDVAGLFAERVGRALRDQGFLGTIGTWRPEDPIPGSGHILELHLLGWEARDGDATCEFRAVLHSPAGKKDLGLFASDEMVVTPDGGHRDAFTGLHEVEKQAISSLWARILAALESSSGT